MVVVAVGQWAMAGGGAIGDVGGQDASSPAARGEGGRCRALGREM